MNVARAHTYTHTPNHTRRDTFDVVLIARPLCATFRQIRVLISFISVFTLFWVCVCVCLSVWKQFCCCFCNIYELKVNAGICSGWFVELKKHKTNICCVAKQSNNGTYECAWEGVNEPGKSTSVCGIWLFSILDKLQIVKCIYATGSTGATVAVALRQHLLQSAACNGA